MKELRSFANLVAILETQRSGSPAKAARALSCAPSSVYRVIERLEKEVGAPLFLRSSKGWMPTDTGLEIVRLAERMQAEVAAAELSLLGRNRRFPAPLRISASDSFATYIGPVLAAFVEREDGVVIDLVADNNVVDLIGRQADIAIRPDMRPGDGLVGRRAGKLAHALYCRASLLESHGMPGSVIDLARYRICALTPALPHFVTSGWWKGLDATPGLSATFFANTELALAAGIAGGAGIGLLPCYVGDRLEGVVRLPAIRVGEPVDIWLVTHPSLRENAVVRALIRELAATIRKDARLFAGSKD